MEFWKLLLNYDDGGVMKSLQVNVYPKRSQALAKKNALQRLNPTVHFSVHKVSHGKGL